MAGTRTPYEFRLFYTVQALTHIARFPCDMVEDYPVGTLFEDMFMRGRNLINHAANVYIENLADMIAPLFGASDDISHAELWRNDAESNASFYVSSFELNLAGTGTGGIAARQVTYTFRTEGGHIVKFVLMENNNSSDTIFRPPYPANVYSDLADFLENSDTPLMGRDDTFAVLSLGFLFTQNEALYRRRFRPT